MRSNGLLALVALVTAIGGFWTTAQADCASLPDHEALATALREAVKPSGGPSNGGLDLVELHVEKVGYASGNGDHGADCEGRL